MVTLKDCDCLVLSLLTILGVISVVFGQASGNGSSSCAVTLKSLASDPAAQSGNSHILLTSPVDVGLEYLCSSGSIYDVTGITCYALKCPAPVIQSYGPYGPYGPQMPGGGGGYGGIPGQPVPVYARYGQSGPISVGPQVAYVETAFGCWKLKQIRVNLYVYLVCFTHDHPSTIFQVVFKDNGLELVNYDAIPYDHLTAVGRGSFTAIDSQFVCVAAVYSSYGPSYQRNDHVYVQPNDQLAPIYIICPSNYKWYFCGNVDIKDTVDVSVWYAQSTLHAIFVQVRLLTASSAEVGGKRNCILTPIIQYTITPEIDFYTCASKRETEILTIGSASIDDVARSNVPEAKDNIYQLHGIQTCTIVSNNNATLLCCAVDANPSCPSEPSRAQQYSSFCIPYDTNNNLFLTERVVFLIGSEHATDIQLTRANGECCQFIMVNGPAQSTLFYSVQAIITNLNNLTNPNPVSISPTNTGDGHLFSNALSCSTKVKCCGTSSTCVTCVRPAKYADKYLAELSCPGITPPLYSGYEDGSLPYGASQIMQQYGVQMPGGGVQLSPYANQRPGNYSNQLIGGGYQLQQGIPQQQQQQQQMPHPGGPYQSMPNAYNVGPPQQPIYGIRYN